MIANKKSGLLSNETCEQCDPIAINLEQIKPRPYAKLSYYCKLKKYRVRLLLRYLKNGQTSDICYCDFGKICILIYVKNIRMRIAIIVILNQS